MKTLKMLVKVFAALLLLHCGRRNANAVEGGVLHSSPDLAVEWEIDGNEKTVNFGLVIPNNAETLYIHVGFMDPQKRMKKGSDLKGADVVTIAVQSEEEERKWKIWIQDGNIAEDGTLVPDFKSQDYVLDRDGVDNGTHYLFRISRLLETCDDEDYPITFSTLQFFCFMTDTADLTGLNLPINYGTARGVKMFTERPINLLTQQRNTPPKEALVKEFVVRPNVSESTSFWYGFFRVPDGLEKLIAFEAILDDFTKKHVHHIDVYNCSNFDAGLFTDGQEFEKGIGDSFCDEKVVLSWSYGGDIAVFPEDVFLELQPRLYKMHVHLDKGDFPKETMAVRTGLRLYFKAPSSKSRKEIIIGQTTIAKGTIWIPANSPDFVESSHFGTSTSGIDFPTSGITIYGVTFHSHRSGIGMKLRHFRDKKELPWILNDQKYVFKYQQAHILPTPVEVRKGDVLRLECTYDTRWTNTSVEFGMTTADEMCFAFLLLSPHFTDYWTESFTESKLDLSKPYRSSNTCGLLGATAATSNTVKKDLSRPKTGEDTEIQKTESKKTATGAEESEVLPVLKALAEDYQQTAIQLENDHGVLEGKQDSLYKNTELQLDQGNQILFELSEIRENQAEVINLVKEQQRLLNSSTSTKKEDHALRQSTFPMNVTRRQNAEWTILVLSLAFGGGLVLGVVMVKLVLLMKYKANSSSKRYGLLDSSDTDSVQFEGEKVLKENV